MIDGDWTGEVWGVMNAALCYHRYKDCPEIMDHVGRPVNTPIRYPSFFEAVKAGHANECLVCRRGMLVEYEDGLYMRLTVEQVDTMRAIKRVHAETGKPLTLSQIAQARGRKISTCFAIVKGLVRKGLAKKRYAKNGTKATNGSIEPTDLSEKILRKIPS